MKRKYEYEKTDPTFREYCDALGSARKMVDDLAAEVIDGMVYYEYRGSKVHARKPILNKSAYFQSVMTKIDELADGQLLVYEDKDGVLFIFEAIGPITSMKPATAVIPRVGTEIRIQKGTTVMAPLPMWAGRSLRGFRLPTLEEAKHYENQITI